MRNEKIVKVHQVDAFTETPGKGNPAGVVADRAELTDEQMQEIAEKVGFNETVFILPSDRGDVRLRYFTPGYETPLCGHATMGAVKFLYQEGKIPGRCCIETMVGVLDIAVSATGEITMVQDRPRFKAFEGSLEALCQVLGIQREDLDESLPVMYGNTGSWTLVLPVKDEAVLEKMRPDTPAFPAVLQVVPKSSIHPFAILSKGEKIFSARHFSSPYSGTVEDSVTGTASGVMAAYFKCYLYPEETAVEVLIHQGKFMGKEGIVRAFAVEDGEEIQVRIAGNAVINPLVMEIELG